MLNIPEQFMNLQTGLSYILVVLVVLVLMVFVL